LTKELTQADIKAIEEHNYREIEMLNQRGGRTLSIVDLIEANTISQEMAAFAFYAISNGASFLTAARPGGAGKTTVLACLLNFMPPGTRIVTTSGRGVISSLLKKPADAPQCVLAHEIGSGHWYGYIWGTDVRDYTSLIGGNTRIGSCIHADTLDELRGIMVSGELKVTEEQFRKIDLLLFMHVEGGFTGRKRRVATFYEPSEGEESHRLLFEWQPTTDGYVQRNSSLLLERIAEGRGQAVEAVNGELREYEAFVQKLVADGENDSREVRRRTTQFLLDTQP